MLLQPDLRAPVPNREEVLAMRRVAVNAIHRPVVRRDPALGLEAKPHAGLDALLGTHEVLGGPGLLRPLEARAAHALRVLLVAVRELAAVRRLLQIPHVPPEDLRIGGDRHAFRLRLRLEPDEIVDRVVMRVLEVGLEDWPRAAAT